MLHTGVVKWRRQLLSVSSSSSTIVFVIRRLCLDTFLLTGSSNADPFVLIEVKTLTYFIFLIILSIQKTQKQRQDEQTIHRDWKPSRASLGTELHVSAFEIN